MQWRNQVAGHGVVLPSSGLRAGLKNLGHTCCLDSVMQCLSVFGYDASRGSTLRLKNVRLSDGLIAETTMCSLEYLMVIVPTDKKEEPSSIYKGHNGS